MDPRDVIKKAIADGATTSELQVIIAQNLEELKKLPDEEILIFTQEMSGTNFMDAFTSAVAYGEEQDSGLGAFLFGDPDSQLVSGEAPIGPKLGKGGALIGELGEFSSNLKPGILSRIGKGVIQFPGKHKVITAGAGLAAISSLTGGLEGESGGAGTPSSPSEASQNPELMKGRGYGLSNIGITPTQTSTAQRDTAYSGAVPSQRQRETDRSNVDGDFNVMVVDRDGSLTGTPGAVAVISAKDMGLGPIPGLQEMIANTNISSDLGIDLTNVGQDTIQFLTAIMQRANPVGTGSGDREVMKFVTNDVSTIGVDVPFQVRPSTGRAPTTGSITRDRSDPRSKKESIEESKNEASTAPGLSPVNVPGGAQLDSRTFSTYNGRTLLEWASMAAQKYDVPINVLYGLISHESGWSANAVGDNGTSFGLAQIHLTSDAYGGSVSRAQALNPVFALEWTAQKLRQRFNQYGRWDAAVAAHNSPVAANHLVKTGKYLDSKSSNYVTDVLQRANKSGLAAYLLDPGTDIGTSDSGTGVSYTPFQAPDPDESRQYIKDVYEKMLGRKPTDSELTTGVEKILGLSRSAYQANLKQAKGGTSQAVDVGASFQEDLEGTGEFAFHEEVGEQRKFTDYAAGIARLLQSGA